MSIPYISNEDKIPVMAQLAGAELVKPRITNPDGTVVMAHNLGGSHFDRQEDYLKRVQDLLDNNGGFFKELNPQSKKGKELFKINGANVSLNATTRDHKDLINSTHQFSKLMSNQSMIVFDVETIGGSTMRSQFVKDNAYSLSEFSALAYDQAGKVKDSKSLTLLMRMDENTKNKVMTLLNQVSKDRNRFGSLTESEQRQLIDLMRYSTASMDGDMSFTSGNSGKEWISSSGQAIRSMNVTHNSVVEQRFTDKFGKIDIDRVLADWDRSIVHMQSGIKTLSSKKLVSQTEGASMIQQYLKDNQKELFTSYNGYEFDKPLIKDFIIKEAVNRENLQRSAQGLAPLSHEQEVIERETMMKQSRHLLGNHLDMYRLINSTFGTVGELEEALAGTSKNQLTNRQLQTLREFLPDDVKAALAASGEAHNAEADNRTLHAVIQRLMPQIQENLSVLKNPRRMQQVDHRSFSNGTEGLYKGMQLVSNRALMTTDKYDPYSFVLTNQEGEYKLPQYARGRSILRRESLYEFRGIEELKHVEGEQAFQAKFYNPIDDEFAYVVRRGYNAEAQLGEFIQSQFSSNKFGAYDRLNGMKTNELFKLTNDQLREDRAARYYSSLFTSNNYFSGIRIDPETGQLIESTSQGFNAAKANFEASSLYEQYQTERQKNRVSQDSVTRETVYVDGYNAKKEKEKLHKKLDKLFKNKNHKENFFMINGRLRDEAPFYQEAINAIEQSYGTEMQRIHQEAINGVYDKQGHNSWDPKESHKLIDRDYITKLYTIQQERNIAMSLYNNQVEHAMSEMTELQKAQMTRKTIRLEERWQVKITNPIFGNGREFLINFANFEDAQRGISSYLRQTIERDEKKLPSIRLENYNMLINQLDQKGVISHSAHDRLQKLGNATGKAGAKTLAESIFKEVTTNHQMTIYEAQQKLGKRATHESILKESFKMNPGLERVTEQDGVHLGQNPFIRQYVSQDMNQSFIQNALDRAKQYIPTTNVLIEGGIEDKRIELPEFMKSYLGELDKPRANSILKANNLSAVENTLNSIAKHFGDNHSVFMTMDQDLHGRYTGVNFWASEKSRGGQVMNMLESGKTPGNVFHFTLPLIDQSGFMRHGNINVNANMVVDVAHVKGEGKRAILRSSQDVMVDLLDEKLKGASNAARSRKYINEKSGYDRASRMIDKQIKSYLATLSGSDKESNLNDKDSAAVQGNMMDYHKQQGVLFEHAFIQDLRERGFDDFKIEDKDLRGSAYRTNSAGNPVLKDYLSIDDLNEETKIQAIKLRPAWWEANRASEFSEVFLNMGSVKASHSDRIMKAFDNQQFMPLGLLHDTVRDTMSQRFGAEILDSEQRNRINAIPGVDTHLSYMSSYQYNMARDFLHSQGEMMIPDTFQVKAAYMTNVQILNRIDELMDENNARSILVKHKLIEEITEAEAEQRYRNALSNAKTKNDLPAQISREDMLWRDAYVKQVDGKYFEVNPLRLPNMYEQQSVVDEALLKELTIKNSRNYRTDGEIHLIVDPNEVLKPGQSIGSMTHGNGYVEDLIYDGKGEGRIGSIETKDGKVKSMMIDWDEQGFKAFNFAEKSTMQGMPREVISLITGDQDVTMIHAGEVYKHKEHGHFLARLQTSLGVDISQSTGDERTKKIAAIEGAGLKLKWDDQLSVLIDDSYVRPGNYRGGQDEESILKRGGDSLEYSKKMEALVQAKDTNGEYIFKGFENKFSEAISTGHEQMVLAKISNTAKQIDGSGKKVLGYDAEGKPVHGAPDGVSIGHREMRTMTSQGMHETIAYMQQKMIDQGRKQRTISGLDDIDLDRMSGIDYNHKISLAQELDNMVAAVEMGIGKESRSGEFAIVKRIQDFARDLPTKNYSASSYFNTAFDMNQIMEETLWEKAKFEATKAGHMNPDENLLKAYYDQAFSQHKNAELGSKDRIHGFWLELPTAIDSTGKEIMPVIKDLSKYENGASKSAESRKMEDIRTNKVFVPLMHATQDKGNRYLNEIQRQVRNIIEKSEVASKAETFEDKAKGVRELSGAISNYYRTIVQETSSSKGYVSKNLNSLKMENSASGLYKLMNAAESTAYQNKKGYQGEFTVMHAEDAKAMGLSAKEIDAIKNGKEMYVGQIRYPSFHDGAVQYNRLFIGEEGEVAKGEFRTSTFASILKNADSDGDYSFMFTVKDQKVQNEWKNFQEDRIKNYGSFFKKYMGEKQDYNEMVRHMEKTGGDHIRSLLGDEALTIRASNTSQEVVAKVWKGIVGQVSNLNFDIQQLASDMLERGEIDRFQYDRTIDFGRLLEQKIIDSKHGAEGVSSKIIRTLKSGDWDQAGELMREHYPKIKNKKTQEIEMIADGSSLNATTRKMSEFDVEDAFEHARLTIGKATKFYRTEAGAINIDGLDFAKSSGYLGTLDDFAEISRNTLNAQEEGLMSRNNAYLNSMHNHLGIEREPIEDKARRNAEAFRDQTVRAGNTMDGKAAQIASEQQRRLFESNAANPLAELVDASTPSGLGKGKMLAGAGLAVGALVGYNMLIGNSKPPQYNHGGSEQFKRQYTEEQIYGEPSTQSDGMAGMLSNPSEYDYQDRQFENHKVESAAVGRAQENAELQFANIMVSAKGLSRIDDSVSGLINQAMVNSGMATGATNIQMSTTDNTRTMNRIWYRDQVENTMY